MNRKRKLLERRKYERIKEKTRGRLAERKHGTGSSMHATHKSVPKIGNAERKQDRTFMIFSEHIKESNKDFKRIRKIQERKKKKKAYRKRRRRNNDTKIYEARANVGCKIYHFVTYK